MPGHLERPEAIYGGGNPDRFELLDESLEPRGPDMLLEVGDGEVVAAAPL